MSEEQNINTHSDLEDAGKVLDNLNKTMNDGTKEFKPKKEGGYQPRDGGTPREGGYQPREGGAPREGGYQPRDGGAPREGGYQPRDGGAPREGGYQPRDGSRPPMNRGFRPGGGAGGKKKSFFAKKVCKFTTNQIDPATIDYKNIELLKRFIMPSGKIVPRRITGTSSKYQRVLAREIKKARIMAFLPFSAR